MTVDLDGQMNLFDPDGWCGKTCQEPCPPAPRKAKTSASSSKRQRASKTPMPLFLNLQRESGATQGASWETDGASLGEYSMHSFGDRPTYLLTECRLNLEHRNGVVESRLSQILMENAPEKYSLSARACQGILRRAENRGKALPEILRIALENQAKTND